MWGVEGAPVPPLSLPVLDLHHVAQGVEELVALAQGGGLAMLVPFHHGADAVVAQAHQLPQDRRQQHLLQLHKQGQRGLPRWREVGTCEGLSGRTCAR